MHAAHEEQTMQLQGELAELREKYERAAKDARAMQNIARTVSEARAVRSSRSSGHGTPSQHGSPYRPSTARTQASGFGGEQALPCIAESPARGAAGDTLGAQQAHASALTHANVAAHAGLCSQQSAAAPWETMDTPDAAPTFQSHQRHTIGVAESQVRICPIGCLGCCPPTLSASCCI